MGVEQSRIRPLPADIDSKYEEHKKAWHSEEILALAGSRGQAGSGTTLRESVLREAAKVITDFFDEIKAETDVSVLEIMAGNGRAGDLVHSVMTQKLGSINWTATEIQEVKQQSIHPVIFGCDSVDAVTQYGAEHNTLLMISPPPGSDLVNYGDYFAIKEWVKLDNSRFVIIVGELGASDGSEGMYRYMLEDNPVWNCRKRSMIEKGDDLFGGPILKEVFIFEKIDP